MVYYVPSKVLCRFVHMCICAVCAYVRGRVFSALFHYYLPQGEVFTNVKGALSDVRSIGFLDVKGCVNHVFMLKSAFGRHGKSPCFWLGGF